MYINPDLYKSELHSDPWPHIIVDDFFTEDTWNKLKQIPSYLLTDCPNEMLSKYRQKAIDNKVGGYVFDVRNLIDSGVPEDIVETYWDASLELLDNKEKIWELFPEHREGEKYAMSACLNLDFKGNAFPRHPDTLTKSVSFVCYLSPEESTGTVLHEDETSDNMRKEMKWKPNRCTVFCPNQDTWHSFSCEETEHRMVFAIFVERMDKKQFTEKYYFTSGKIAEFKYKVK